MQGQHKEEPPPSPPPLVSEEHDNDNDNDKDKYEQQQQRLQQDQQNQNQERPITIDLIRKRSEHNSNLISDLEEIALHQEELTSIGTTIGKVCGKTLRILLLQNNVISQLSVNEMKYFKVLEYLNLALNNITVVRGFNGFNGFSRFSSGSVDTSISTSKTEKSQSSGNSGSFVGTGVSIYNYNEHLSKIDLTLNFIDYDTLEESMECLSTLRNLKELFMMGNPCCVSIDASQSLQSPSTKDEEEKVGHEAAGNNTPAATTEWKNFRMYVISKLSTLERLDGKEILRSERIRATQMKLKLKDELDLLAKRCKARKEQQRQRQRQQPRNSTHEFKQKMEPGDGTCNESSSKIGQEEEERTKHCPEDRIKLSNEIHMQKKEKERNEKANQPKLKSEKEFEEDQRMAIEKAREREEKGDIKQCNEGKWDFTFDEEKKPGYLTLDISIQRHLSSSLIDVDVHPTYISVVIKSKVLRLRLPIEVKAEDSTAKRSLTTGHLLITMPKFNPKDQAFIVNKEKRKSQSSSVISKGKYGGGNDIQRLVRKNKSKGLQQELLRDAQRTLVGTVQLNHIVKERHDDMRCSKDKEISTKFSPALDLVELSTRTKLGVEENKASTLTDKNNYDEEGPPPMF